VFLEKENLTNICLGEFKMFINERIKKFEKGFFYKTQFDNGDYQKGNILEQMKYYRTPAVSIAVINNYEIEWVKTYGTAERGIDKEIDENTLFQAASMSKPVFALAVMKLVEKGILDLDEDINNYLTSWKVPANGEWQPRITLRQILSHTAGVTVHGFDGYNRKDEIPDMVQILNGQYPANSDAIRVNIIPGIENEYSGGGFTIAQQAVMDVLKKPFPQIMKELILEPLGMENSTYEQPLPDNLRHKAVCAYNGDGDMVDGGYHVYPEMAAAGLWTTPSDLAKLGLELQLTLKEESNKILSKEYLEKMLTTQVGGKYGIGFAIGGEGNNVKFYHSGCNTGFESHMVFYKENGKGMVVMIDSQQDDLLVEIMKSVANAYEWSDLFAEEKSINGLYKYDTQGYSGKYISEANITINIESGNEFIFIVPEAQLPIKLYKESDNKFFAKEVNIAVEFIIADKDNISGLKLSQNGTEYKYMLERSKGEHKF
jgi:CubicO group peptidase (beta-lactamase class C family)